MNDNRQKINFEKHLPKEVIQYDLSGISIWSLIRAPILNQVFNPAQKLNNLDIDSELFKDKLSYSDKLFNLIKFIFSILFKKYKIIIFVNSFSITEKSSKKYGFNNKNLQLIYDKNKNNCIVYINNINPWLIKSSTNNFLIIPDCFIKISKIFIYFFKYLEIKKAKFFFYDSLKVNINFLSSIIRDRLANIFLWRLVLSLIKPKEIFFECPHNSLEAHVVAAKLCEIETNEIYHGLLNPNEFTYFQKHLYFGQKITSVCKKYIAPSAREKRYLRSINNQFQSVDLVSYISPFRYRKKNIYKNLRRNKITLFITTICDFDIKDIKNYILNNKIIGKKIVIRLHPSDDVTRWDRLRRKFLFLKLSTNNLRDDISSADEIIVQSQTVALQLQVNKIQFKNIGRNNVRGQ